MKPKTPKQMTIFPTKLPLLGRACPVLSKGGLGGGLLCFLLLFCSIKPAHAQQKDWQWINRGGAKIEGTEREHVYDIATDSDRNVYVVSPIGVYDLNIDGHPKTYYGGPGGTAGEYALASFACDGAYRWSKIIGGKGNEAQPYIATDGNDNLYLVGSSYNCDGQDHPFRIENDVILSNNTINDCSLGYIAKYDKNGNLLWFKQPMDRTSEQDGADEFGSVNLALDNSGNIYWMVFVPPASYANGTFINTMQGNNWFIFKYDPTGNFINATYFDIQLSPGVAGTSIKMYRNPHNGYFYFTGNRASNESAIVGGQTVTGTFYMASFDGQGNFQWMRQNTYNTIPGGPYIYSLEFDGQNNIYMGGKFIGAGDHVFLGQSVPETMNPRFVMKTNPMATNVFWFSYSDLGGAYNKGGFDMDDNKISYANSGGYQNFSWGSQSININNAGEGAEVIVAFFDKNTGACTGLDFIQGNVGHPDYGTALAFDANGDVLVGGEFEHTLYDANGGSVMNPVPSNPDFFIAKYATEPCPPLGVESFGETGTEVYPNPVRNRLTIQSEINWSHYKIYSILGKTVMQGQLSPNKQEIDLENLSPGVYLLKLKGSQGEWNELKIIKE